MQPLNNLTDELKILHTQSPQLVNSEWNTICNIGFDICKVLQKAFAEKKVLGENTNLNSILK